MDRLALPFALEQPHDDSKECKAQSFRVGFLGISVSLSSFVVLATVGRYNFHLDFTTPSN